MQFLQPNRLRIASDRLEVVITTNRSAELQPIGWLTLNDFGLYSSLCISSCTIHTWLTLNLELRNDQTSVSPHEFLHKLDFELGNLHVSACAPFSSLFPHFSYIWLHMLQKHTLIRFCCKSI